MHRELLFRFQEHLKVLNRSPATVKAYAMHAKAFLQSMNVKDIKQVTTTMIESWIANLWDYRNDQNKPYSTGTVSIKIRSVKRFFEFLEKTNVIFIDPADFIREPKKNIRLMNGIGRTGGDTKSTPITQISLVREGVRR